MYDVRNTWGPSIVARGVALLETDHAPGRDVTVEFDERRGRDLFSPD
jgi:hypothetical protein